MYTLCFDFKVQKAPNLYAVDGQDQKVYTYILYI